MSFITELQEISQSAQATADHRAKKIAAVGQAWEKCQHLAASSIGVAVEICVNAKIQADRSFSLDRVLFSVHCPLQQTRCRNIDLEFFRCDWKIICRKSAIAIGGQEVCRSEESFDGDLEELISPTRKSSHSVEWNPEKTFEDWVRSEVLSTIRLATDNTRYDLWFDRHKHSKEVAVLAVEPKEELVEVRRLLTKIYYRLDRLK